MKDLIVIVMTVAFFAIAVAYVALCNRIIGPDEPSDGTTGDTSDDDIGGDAGDQSAAAAQEVTA